MGVSFSGITGELRYGYHVVAIVGDWTLENRTLDARIVRVINALYLKQPSLTFVIPRPSRRTWSKDLIDVRITGDALTARLGPTERQHGANAQTRDDAARPV